MYIVLFKENAPGYEHAFFFLDKKNIEDFNTKIKLLIKQLIFIVNLATF